MTLSNGSLKMILDAGQVRLREEAEDDLFSLVIF